MMETLRRWLGRTRVAIAHSLLPVVALTGLLVPASSARASDLDVAFDADVRSFGRVSVVAYQPDGKVLAGGLFTAAQGAVRTNLARFLANGSLDPTFNPGVNLDGGVRAIAVQSDGKIVIAGSFTNYGATARARIARLNADGTLDATFAPGTGFNAEVLDLALQSDGKVIAVGLFTTFNGTTRNRVARLNANGTLDTTFLASGAAANGVVWDVALQSDGKPVIAGAFTTYNGTARNRIARLTTAGALDTTIAFTGGANNDIYSVALDASGRFVIGGGFTTWNGTARRNIARLTTAGAVDTTFDPGATSFDNVVVKVAIDSAGRVLVAGRMQSFDGTALPAHGIARLTNTGAIDAAFVPAEGAVRFARERFAESLAVNAADGVLVSGSLFDPAGTGSLVAFTSAGALDSAVDFGRGLEVAAVVNAVRPGRDGKYWVVGEFDWIGGDARPGVARFLPNAQLDPDFVPREGFGDGGYFNAPVADGVELPNGSFWVFGPFTEYGVSYDRPGAALFSSDGFPEITSTELTITGGTVRRAMLGSDGKVTLAGTFTSVNGTARAGVARVLTTGALDTTFAPGSGPAGGQIIAADLDADGRLLVAGTFTSFSGTAESYLVRLSAAGAVDTAFAGNTAVSAAVNSVQVLPGGKTLIGGTFANSGGFAVNGVDRLNADGTSDGTFNPGAGANSYVYDARADAAGRVLLAGAFTTVRGEARPGGLARLSATGASDNLFTQTSLAGGYPFGLAERPDGKVLVRGSFTGVDGMARAALARFHAVPVRRGALVTALDGSVLASADVRAALPAADGGFVIAGDFTGAGGATRARVAKLGLAGAIDATFAYTTGFNASVQGGALEPDGKFLFWGAFASYNGTGASGVVRVNADGTRDTGFVAPTFNSTVHAVVRLPDGDYLVAGAFTSADATTVGGLVRLNANGSLDPAFNAGVGANGAVLALARAGDGSIFAGGAFTTFAGASAPGVVKLTATGVRGVGFDIGTGNPSTGNPVRALALQNDGKLLVGGAFTTFNGQTVARLIRLNADGTRDATFLGGFGADGLVNVLVPIADGRVYVGGAFTALGGGERRGLARLTAAGAIDPVFDVGAGFNNEVLVVTPFADGRVAVGGKFTMVNGVARNRFAVLYASDDGAPSLGGSGELQTIEVNPGQAFTLSLGAPVEGFNYQWYRDGRLLAGATGASYSVTAAGLADLGLYTTVVSNGGGEVTTAGTRVIVRLAPTVVSAPLAQAVGYGAGATFSVSVSGPGPFDYQWFRNGEAMAGQTESSLELTNVGDADFGDTFFVRVTNDYGTLDTTPVALTFDPAAVPGALVRAFPTQLPALTSAADVMVRTPGGQFYVATGSQFLRLNADGSTDGSFTPAFASYSVDQMALQPDGKLVLAGYFVPAGSSIARSVVRLLPSGSIDPVFAAPTIDTGSFTALALQADGKVVIGGNFTAVGATARRYLARLNADGTLDSTFAPADDATGPNLNGIVRAIVVQGTSLIVAGDFTTYRGTTVNRLVRLSSTNTVDTTFQGGTRADGPVQGMFAQADGKIFIRGAFSFYGGTARNRLARLNANGSLDTAFDPGAGPSRTSRFDPPTITDFAPGENNALIVMGAFERFSGWPATNLVRLTATGAVDTQWAAPANANGRTLLPTSDGQLFVSGFFTFPGVTGTQYLGRLLGGTFPPQPPSFIVQPAGNTFSYPAGSQHSLSGLATGPGTLTFQWFRNGVAVSDSATVLGATTPILRFRSLRAAEAGAYTLRVTSSTHGATTSAVAQVNVGPEPTGLGSIDLAWAADPLPRALLALTFAPDGTAFATGNDWDLDEYFVFKFDANGVLQPPSVFAQGSGFDSNVNSLVRQSDGKVVVAGFFTTALSTARNYLARLNANGSLDAAFNPNPNAAVVTMIAQSDGKLLVGGSFTNIAGTNRTAIARLLATGAIDTTFAPGAHGLAEIKRVLVAADGKVYVIGRNNTTSTEDIVRLTATGALDGTFTRISAPSSSIQGATLDSSGRLIVVGSFTNIAGQSRNRIARFSPTGGLDANFGPSRSSGPSAALQDVLAAPDGYYYLLTESSVFTYDGFDLGLIVRIDAEGRLDPNFPASTATRLTSLSSSELAWVGNRLLVTTSSNWVRLKVDGGPTGAPVLAASSGDRTVVEGLGVSLTARFEGAGPFTYEWRRAGTLIPGATGPQLWLPNPTAADGGVYTVTATNGLGSATTTLNLNFFPAEPLSPVAGISLDGNFNSAIRRVVRLADGGVLVGGDFRTVAGVNSPFVAKLKPDGTLDTTFAAALPFSTSAFGSLATLAVEADGRILVHGSLTMTDNSSASLVRLNANGTLAGTLLSSTNMSGAPAVMALQADGKIVIAGNFTAVLGQPRAGLARLLANGTLDPTYQADGIVSNSGIQAIHVDASGRVLLAGNFTSVGGVATSGRIVRLNPDGTLDASFRHTAVTGQISGFFRAADNRLFVYGTSTLTLVGGMNVSVVQFDDTGDVVPTFVAPNQNAVGAMAEDLHGRLYLVQANALVRLLPGGLVERTTSLGSGANVLLRADDRLLIAGGSNLSSVNGLPVRGIAYLSVDGESPLALLASPARTVTASEGATLTLRAGVRGPAGTTYQWFRGSDAVAGATTPVLVVSGLTPAASGDYTLVATHNGAQISTVASTVTVQGNLGRPGDVDLAWGAGRTVTGVSGAFADAAGRIYLRGNVQVDGSPARSLVALDANGAVRTDFTLSPRVTGQFQTVMPQPDGKLLIGGSMSQLKLDNNEVAVVRLNADGSVDASFTAGVVSSSGFVNQVRVLTDGRIIAFGSFTTYAGAARSNVVRLSANGVLDATFTGETGQGGSIVALLPAAEGKVWVIGSFDEANFRRFFYRLNPDGTRDTTFTARPSYPQGSSSENIRRAVPAADGGFYLLTYRSGSPESSPLRRVTPEGEYDGSFQPGVFARTDFAVASTLSDLAIDASGRLLVVGQFSRHDGVVRNGVARLLADGRPDLSFGAALPVLATQSSAPNLVQVAGDRVLVYREALADYGGVNDRSGLYALHATELPAATAPVLTGVVSPVSVATYDPLSLSLPVLAPAGAAIQWFRNGVAIDGATSTCYRLRGAGPADGGSYHATVQTAGGLLTVPAVSVTTPALGYSGALSARNTLVSIDGTIRFAVKQPDGRILVVSDGVFVNGEGPYELFRLNADGTFHSGLPTRVRYYYESTSPVQVAAVDAAGRIYLGGSFNSVSGVTRNRIVRLLADGTVDPAWDAGTGPNSTVNRLALTPDGKLIVGGSFSQVNGVARQYLARLGTDGAVDPTLVTGTSLNGVPQVIHVQSDGRIVVGGNFMTYNGGTAVRLIRLETNGALDATFAPAPSAVVNTLIALTDGRLLAGGNFSTIGGQSRQGLALLSAAGAVLEPALNFGNGFSALAEAGDGGFFTLASTQVSRFSAAAVRDTVFSNANGYRGGFTNANSTPQSVNPTSLVAFGTEVLVAGPYVRSGAATRNGLAWIGASESLAPVITTAPVNATLPEGGAVTWSVGVASTTGTLTYTWTKVGAGTVLSTNTQLARPNVTVADAGTYRVVVNNGEGTAEATVVLTVTPAPVPVPGSPLLGFYAPTLSSGSTVFLADGGKWWAWNGGTFNRLLPDGQVDPDYVGPTFAGGGLSNLWRAPDGRIYISGSFTSVDGQPATRLARFTAAGIFDPTFVAPFGSITSSSLSVQSLAFSGDGKIYVGGAMKGLSVGGRPTNHLVRLLANGSIDPEFDPLGGMSLGSNDSDRVLAVVALTDGRVLAGGTFTTAAGAARKGLVRFLPSGALDPTFNNIDINGVQQIEVLPDGKLLVRGNFSTVDGVNRPRLVRLSADGVVDPAFAITGVTVNSISSFLVRPDGRIVLFAQLNEGGSNRSRVVQLLADGSVDPTFDYVHAYNADATGTAGSVTRGLMLPDGNLLVMGSFSFIDMGIVRNGLVLVQGSPLAPAIVTPPQTTTVAGGTPVTLGVTVSGTGPFNYQWRRGTSPIAGAESATYTLDPALAADAGDYSVVVSNTVGSVTSAAATLTVTQSAQTITFAALSDVEFSATPISLEASASSGLAVTFAVVDGPATINGSALTLTGPGTVTVRATQAGNAAYLAAVPVERTFTASAPTSGFAAWREIAFTAGELANLAISGPNADPDRDGLPNLLEYALGLAPKTANTSGLPQVGASASEWTYTYTRPANRSDVTYAVERSTTLTSWTTANVTHELVSTDAVAGTQTWRASVPLTVGANLFFRLKVETP